VASSVFQLVADMAGVSFLFDSITGKAFSQGDGRKTVSENNCTAEDQKRLKTCEDASWATLGLLQRPVYTY